MANTSNYQQNSIDLDFIYIGANESEYFSLDPQSIKNRKTVMFGQNLINNSYRVVNVGNKFLPSTVNVPKNDYDNTQVIGVTPTAIYYSDTTKTQTYVRGAFNLLENTPQISSWLITAQTSRSSPVQLSGLANVDIHILWLSKLTGLYGHGDLMLKDN